MRTIKFRSWNPLLKEMFTGENVSLAYDYETKSFVDYSFCDRKKVDEILMQFTGLRDKNGVEIYEGDFLTFEVFDGLVNATGTLNVYFDSGCFRANRFHPLADYLRNGTVEVIGNKYENPELFKEESE